MINRVFFRSFVLAAVFGLLTENAAAQVGAESLRCGQEREVQAGLLSEATYKRMNGAFEKLGEEKYNEALADLQKLSESRLNDYEKASVQQAMGFARAQLEQYEAAVRHFEEAIRLNQMPNQAHFEMILQVAQLYNALRRYDDALRQLDFWFCVSTEDAKKQAEVWVLKASLHVQKEEYREALSAVDQAIELRLDPPETWYQLKLGMHLELKQYRPATEVLKILIRMNPDRKEYWIQLAGSYLELDENAEAMSTLRLAYRRDLLSTNTEFLQLAGLLQDMESPRQAAEVLSEGLTRGVVEATVRNWEVVAGAWYQAREMSKALDAYERAGSLSSDGKIDFQRASIMVSQENWPGVIDAAARALEKGGLNESQQGNAHLIIGMAHFNLGDLGAAEQAFKRAENYGRIRSAAREWLNHIQQTRNQMASR
ncbi:MAG: tetratricopeptide repeat protein [Gammaproteobacteria bacterium]|nr:tetratricopeptide repeat protein [Gammaproteobacteria bacterium]